MGVATNPSNLARLGIIDPRDFGARADGVTDCTAALNAAIAAAPPGSTIYFPPGQWLFAGNVTLASGITIMGSQRFLAGAGLSGDDLTHCGTLFLVTGGHGTTSSSATAFITPVGLSCAIDSIAFYYPNQGNADDNTIVGYPYTIGTAYQDPSLGPAASSLVIRNCTFRNSYQGIRIWCVWPFLIERCHVSAAVNGIWVDYMADTSYLHDIWVEPVGFSKRAGTPLSATWRTWAQQNLIAYRFGRVDSLTMTNCMSYPAKTGVLLEYTGFPGASGGFRPWLLMSNCVIDLSDICLDVQSVPSQGIRVSNCSLSAMGGTPDCIGIRVGSDAGAENGVFTITNTDIAANSVVRIAGGRSRYIGCTFREASSTAIIATGGDVAVVGCDFKDSQPQLAFSGGGKAIFANNTTGAGGVSVTGVTASNCV